MKRFFIASFALTLFSTANVFGASHSSNNDIYDFLTINGKPINQHYKNNTPQYQNDSNNKTDNDFQNCTVNTHHSNSTHKPHADNKPSNSIQNHKPNDSSKPNNNSDTIKNPTNTENNISDSSVSNVEKEVVRLVNIERKKAGLSPLKLDNELSKIARLKSEDMKKKGYFSHTSPTYGSPFDMLKQFNVSYKSAGENIAKGQKTAEAVVDAWMHSEGHKRNILSKSFTHIGVGFVSNHWTQLFTSK